MLLGVPSNRRVTFLWGVADESPFCKPYPAMKDSGGPRFGGSAPDLIGGSGVARSGVGATCPSFPRTRESRVRPMKQPAVYILASRRMEPYIPG